ncbi:MAG: hypothetical protein M1825_002746 [Sarcosagium campestre]|nr:MAG: hypothetical protein M1825_002746 [Sarcosagium campestre]
MSSSITVHAPHIVLPLPQPLSTSRGNYHAACVWSGAAGSSKKRKHSELAVSIDGEGINIYSIRNSRLEASYALPPQSSFTCPPCSIRQRIAGTSSDRRVTYVSTISDKRQLLCFSDRAKESSGTVSFGGSHDSVLKHGLELDSPDVVYLDTIPKCYIDSGDAEDFASDLLAVSEDGSVSCLSGDLSEYRWQSTASATLGSSGSRKSAVEYATITSVADARKGLLKDRDDLLGYLSPQTDGDKVDKPSASLLLLLSRPMVDSDVEKTGRRLHISTIRPSNANGNRSNRSGLQSLAVVDLPSFNVISAHPIQCLLHPTSGTLQYSSNEAVVTLDVSGTVPKVISRIAVEKGTPTSIIRLSKALIMTATSTAISIYDVRYQSVQGHVGLDDPSQPQRKKRKTSSTSKSLSATPITFAAYFPAMGLAIGLSQGSLTGIQVTSSIGARGNKVPLMRGDLLHAIGRGSKSGLRHQGLTVTHDPPTSRCFERWYPGLNDDEDVKWNAQMAELDGAVASGDVECFERVLAKSVGIGRRNKALKIWEANEKARKDREISDARPVVNGFQLTNGNNSPCAHDKEKGDEGDDLVEEEEKTVQNEHVLQQENIKKRTGEKKAPTLGPKPLPTWRTQKASLYPGTKNRRQCLYAISKIFSYQTKSPLESSGAEVTDSRALRISFHAPNALKWLMDSGELSTDTIIDALWQYSPELTSRLTLSSEDLVGALVNADPEMNLLRHALLAPVVLSPEEIVHAARLIMQSLEYPESVALRPERLLTNGHADDDLEAYKDLPAMIKRDLEAAEQDISLVAAIFEQSPAIRQNALSLALLRLHQSPPSAISRAMRRAMTRDEIISLIHLLRVELARNGWLSQHLNTMREADVDEQIPDGEVALIGNLLGCTIDAIGTGGWATGLLGSSSTNDDDDTINNNYDAPTETEELVAALQAEVCAALEGIEEAIYLEGFVGEMLLFGKSARNSKNALHKVATAQDGIIVRSDETESAMLPLGLRAADEDVSQMKTRAGGEITKRSTRDLERLRRQRVGQYSLERIVI